MQEISFRAMGSQMQAVLDDDGAPAAAALAQVPGWFEGWEQRLSRFRATSELSRLNDSHGQEVPMSAVLWEVVDLALRVAGESGGLVTPVLLQALEAAGYDRTFDKLVQRADLPGLEHEWQPLGPAPMARDVIVRDAGRRSLRLLEGARLDLGGVGKGWAADLAARRLSAFGPALVDAGGDIGIAGPRLGAEPWTVGVTNPFFPNEAVESLALTSAAGVATSGRDHRRWQRGGQWYHHILDPRTGRPAQTDLLTVTALGQTASQAEAAAKTVLILGSAQGAAWLEARPELAGLLILEDGRLLRTTRLAAYSGCVEA